MNEFHRQEGEHAPLGMQLPRGNAQEDEIHDQLGQDAEYAPLPWEIQKKYAPRAHEHPDIVCVDQGEEHDIGFALVVSAVAAPAGALVEELFPRVYGGGLDDGVFVEIVAHLGARDLHHFVDEHVVVAAREVDEVAKAADFEKQVLFVGKACGGGDNRSPEAEPGSFHRGIAERFELLVKVRHGTGAIVLLWPLYNADSIHETARHRGNPALARDAVGVHRQEHFVFCNLESAFEPKQTEPP